ncbi:MAG: SDR family NAD(P)-dependent oxidoreductase [Gammaproteobacteria bacterium]|nr:SDR family NAD(P)-dependent oxidoreductase [Gammaproteobacteria bacterium]
MNKIAVITGASSGIGRAVAIDLAAHGYNVVLVSRSIDKLQLLQYEITKSGGTAQVYALDVADSVAVDACISDVVTTLGRIDVLFNNAGVIYSETSEITNQNLKHMIDVNLLGAMSVGNAVARQMKKQRSGYIINLSSIGGKVPSAMLGGYNSSKFGLVGYGDALCQEMLAYSVKVTTLCPGMISTDMVKGVLNRSGIDAEEIMQPEHIIKTIHYLLELGDAVVIKELVLDSTVIMKKKVAAISSVYGNKTNNR